MKNDNGKHYAQVTRLKTLRYNLNSIIPGMTSVIFAVIVLTKNTHNKGPNY